MLGGRHECACASPPCPAAAKPHAQPRFLELFTPEMSLAMHKLARRQRRTLQSMMAETFNDVLPKHSESPIGE